jgi:hypothetical protein
VIWAVERAGNARAPKSARRRSLANKRFILTS